jgi:prophage antirepressor-like protein
MKKVKDKFERGDKYYVSEKTCMDILEQGKSKKCKEIIEGIGEDSDEDNSSIIDVKKNIFQYDGTKFTSFFIIKDENWDIWLKAKQVAKYLEYENTRDAIINHVDDENKISYENLLELLPGRETRLPKNLDKKTIFINISGFFNLIHNSKQKLAKQIKKWIDNEVMPALVKYGSYSMQPKTLNIKLFYDENAISNFYNKSVMYIGYLGKIEGKISGNGCDEYMFKYGLSRKIFKRDYEQHSRNFEMFEVIYIGETDNCEYIESLFEQDLKTWQLHRTYKKHGTEFFTISTKRSIEDLVDHMKKLINDNQLPAIKEASNEVAKLTNMMDLHKQNDRLRELEIQFQMSDNYKLKIGGEIEIKKLEIEKDIAIRKLDLEIEKEKTKQICIQNNKTDVIVKTEIKSEHISTKHHNKKTKKGNNVISL